MKKWYWTNKQADPCGCPTVLGPNQNFWWILVCKSEGYMPQTTKFINFCSNTLELNFGQICKFKVTQKKTWHRPFTNTHRIHVLISLKDCWVFFCTFITSSRYRQVNWYYPFTNTHWIPISLKYCWVGFFCTFITSSV